MKETEIKQLVEQMIEDKVDKGELEPLEKGIKKQPRYSAQEIDAVVPDKGIDARTKIRDESMAAVLDERYVEVAGDTMTGDLAIEGELAVDGRFLAKDKIAFTQTDEEEYIDSLNDGYMDYGATTRHRFNAPVTVADKTLLGTPVVGTFEFDNDRMYVTNVGTQRAIDRTSDVALETVTVANTTTETTLWTAAMPANSVKVGNVFRFIADGCISSASASDTVTFRVKVGGVTKVTLDSEAKQLTDDCWHLRTNATQRTLGVTGSRAMHIDLVVDDVLTELCAVGTVDTTSSMDITLTVKWNNAKAGNTVSLFQGFMGYRN